MNQTFLRGRLERWDDAKGFGFIKPDDGRRNIFIHISALKKMNRRPVTGDIIHYQIHTDNNGKDRAVNASIVGVPEIAPTNRARRRHNPQRKGASFLSRILPIVVIMGAWQIYDHLTDNNHRPETDPAAAVVEPFAETPAFECRGKVYCSEMSSCEEAEFYLRNCPGTKMDGDNDGIPCERQCGY